MIVVSGHNNGIPAQQRYPPMRDALNHTGRPILYSICEWGESTPYLWAPEVGNSWRTTGDIVDTWGSMLFNIDANDVGWKAAGPGAYNDADMLEVSESLQRCRKPQPRRKRQRRPKRSAAPALVVP